MKTTLPLLALLAALAPALAEAAAQPQIGSRSKPRLQVDGLAFRDLNADGRLEPYEDWRLSPERRAADLTARMTLAEKAGVMMHGTAPLPADGAAPKGYDLVAARALIDKGVNTFITRLSGAPRMIAEADNALQAIAEQTRLGVPLTLSTDPRNHFGATVGISVGSTGFSRWPELIGFGAAGDPELVRRFGDIARREYRAVGIHQALSPQADLATEPRWPRIDGTFGEDPELARRLVQAYVEGFQGGAGGLARDGVATVVKHWAGYGAARDGWDGHNDYGQHAVFPGGGFERHLRPFEGAFAAHVAGVMPTYAILDGVNVGGRPLEPVGAGFSRQLLTELLRERYGFDGVVLSDWGVTSDCDPVCRGGWRPGQPPSIGMPWGVEGLTRTERFAKGVEAGLDQFGGVTESERLVEAVGSGLVTEARLDESVRRILAQKFRLGLFENPYVDPAAAEGLVGRPEFQAAADEAQRRSLVLLENRGRLLPLRPGARVFLRGIAPEAAQARGLVVVATPEEAEVALVRIAAPYQTRHPHHFFGSRQHEGDLDFKPDSEDLAAVRAASTRAPTVVTVLLDRPAILGEVRDRAAALIGNFGVADGPLLDVVTGRAKPQGKLPFELPSSMAEVEAQAPDLPHDTGHPLYPFGYGLSY